MDMELTADFPFQSNTEIFALIFDVLKITFCSQPVRHLYYIKMKPEFLRKGKELSTNKEQSAYCKFY